MSYLDPVETLIRHFDLARNYVSFVEASALACDGEEPERWQVRDLAHEERADLTTRWIVREGYAVVEQPMPAEGIDWVLVMSLTERGERAYDTLKRGLVFNTDTNDADIAQTVLFYTQTMRDRHYVTRRLLRQVEKIDHPIRHRILGEIAKFVMLAKPEGYIAACGEFGWERDPEIEAV